VLFRDAAHPANLRSLTLFFERGDVLVSKPAVILIGADKGGVGKTTVARTLLDYFAHHRLGARAFDTEVPRGTLKRFHPDVTDVVVTCPNSSDHG
jgi:hypothetical protein